MARICQNCICQPKKALVGLCLRGGSRADFSPGKTLHLLVTTSNQDTVPYGDGQPIFTAAGLATAGATAEPDGHHFATVGPHNVKGAGRATLGFLLKQLFNLEEKHSG